MENRQVQMFGAENYDITSSYYPINPIVPL